MILLLDTSAPRCKMRIIDGDYDEKFEWQSERELAKGLLAWINDIVSRRNMKLSDIKSIGVFRGPGSFTGLRIGLTVANTLADSMRVPIIGASDDNWQTLALERLANNENDHLVLPLYGRDAYITMPRK